MQDYTFGGPMFMIFQGSETAESYYARMIRSAEIEIMKIQPDQLADTPEDQVVQLVADRLVLDRISEDASRGVVASQDFNIYVHEIPTNDPTVKNFIEHIEAKVIIPLLPMKRPHEILKLYKGPETSSGKYIIAAYHIPINSIVVTGHPNDIDEWTAKIRERLDKIDSDVKEHTPNFINKIRSAVRSRRIHLEAISQSYRSRLKQSGIRLVKREEAFAPVDLSIKHEVEILRGLEHETRSTDPYLSIDSADQIFSLMQQAGRGFETSPGVFGQFREETLTTILINYLNAVFERPVATGETFSISGKTDILLNVTGGPVLVGECHWWDGKNTYIEKLEQLFGYVAFRQTVAMMITFSDRSDPTRVVTAAREAVKDHPTCRESPETLSPTRFSSAHIHPRDTEKVIAVQHLHFAIRIPPDAVRGSAILRTRQEAP